MDSTNKSDVQNVKDIIDDENYENYELIFEELEAYLNDAKKIVTEQHQAKNYRWAK